MKNLILIALLLYTGFAGAQRLSRKKIDPKTGDTTQFTREQTLFNPISNYLFDNSNYVGWFIEKISAKEHRGDTVLLCLRIVPTNGFMLSRDSSMLTVMLVSGHTLNLPAKSTMQYQYGGGGLSSPKHSDIDIYATYALPKSVIHMITADPITAISLHTTNGPVNYAIELHNALKIQKYLTVIGKG